MRRVTALILLLAIVPAGPARAAQCWPPPTAAPVADPYREPACPWCPGNRGITYSTPPGTPVRAVAAGVVTFAGEVADAGYVVVELANGWRLTYGDLARRTVAAGDVVLAGSRLGTTAGELHFGLRDRAAAGPEAYLDPTQHLGVWRYRVRLIPLAGEPRPAPAPTLRCQA